MDDEKPRVLPKTRGRQDTIRIEPIRRNTLRADAWGFHSVSGMLNDFQRHTSHTIGGQLADDAKVASAAQTPDSFRYDAHIFSAIAYVALATTIAAVRIAAPGPSFDSLLLVSGLALAMTALCTNWTLRRTLQWPLSLALISAASTSTALPIIAGLAALPSAGVKFGSWTLTWVAAVIIYLLWESSILGGLKLAVTGLAAIGLITSGQSGTGPSAAKARDRILCYVLSMGLVSVSFLASVPQFVPLVGSLIMCGSLAVFFFSGEATTSNYDVLLSGTAVLLVEVSLGARVSLTTLMSVAILVPSLFCRDKHSDMSDPLSLANSTSPRLGTWSVLDSILAHDDTRGIFYFFLLNFCFMLIQLLYSLLSHSLGLLSDSIHMFFDCLALLVGLVASILAKLPPSSRFPYGLAMVETVSGFANGCLLLAISVGVLFEAFERIANPVQLEKITELIIVSILGLIVNLVGIFAFNHGHAHGHSHGHAHGHSHGHAHGHSHGHAHGHAHAHGHSHGHGHSHSHSHDHAHSGAQTLSNPFAPAETTRQASSPAATHLHDHSQSHGHSHGHNHHNHEHGEVHEHSYEPQSATEEDSHTSSDNLEGIFLHIVADTLGSVGVIISTLLTYWFGWSGFDAIASIVISVLIFVSAIPLVKSSANSLLLSLKDADEYKIRNLLNEIYNTQGVASYKVPKFWNDGKGIRGTIHVQYQPSSDANVVRDKVRALLLNGGVDQVVIQMEEEGAPCWCSQDPQ